MECGGKHSAPHRGRLRRPLVATALKPLLAFSARGTRLAGGSRGIQKCDSVEPLSLVIKCLGGGGHESEDSKVRTFEKRPSLSRDQVNTHTPQPPSIAPRSNHQQTPTPGQATPRRLDFADTPAQPIPRVPLVSPPANSDPPPVPPALLPVCKPISHHTRSHAQAPLALFTSVRPYHEQVKYRIPTAKATRPAEEPLAFAGLCETYQMKLAEVDAFAFFSVKL